MLKKEMLSQEKLQNFCKSVPAKTKQTNKKKNPTNQTNKKTLVLCEISLVALKMLTAQISQVKQTIYFCT